jgi:hypothetical protein
MGDDTFSGDESRRLVPMQSSDNQYGRACTAPARGRDHSLGSAPWMGNSRDSITQCAHEMPLASWARFNSASIKERLSPRKIDSVSIPTKRPSSTTGRQPTPRSRIN